MTHLAFALSTRGYVFGGLETIADHLAAGAAARGYRVSLLAGYVPGRGARCDWPAGVAVRRLPVLDWRTSPARALARAARVPPLHVQSASFVTVAMLRSATRGTLESADVLVSFLEGETTLLSRLRARRGRPTLSYLAGVLDLRWARADRSAVRLATSAMLAEQAAQHGLACDGVLTPGIDAALLRLPRRAPSNGQQRLLYVGRLEPNKRVERLLPLVSALEGATLTVVGDGPCRAELLAAARAQGVSERVIFRGPLAPSAVADALRQADVFVFPSAYESFGAAVLEAMGAGLPIVATDLPALREATGGHALLVADDPATWVRCTREVLEHPELYARLSVEGRAWAADFTWERIVDRFDAYLQVALQSTTAQST